MRRRVVLICSIGDLFDYLLYYQHMKDIRFIELNENHLNELSEWHQDKELSNRYGGSEWPKKLWEIMGNDENRKCWIALNDDKPIAYVDFEIHPNALAWIGIAVKPTMRGQGLGKRILANFLESEYVKDFDEIRAGIEFDNIASIKCFESVGFIPLNNQPDEEGIIDFSLML